MCAEEKDDETWLYGVVGLPTYLFLFVLIITERKLNSNTNYLCWRGMDHQNLIGRRQFQFWWYCGHRGLWRWTACVSIKSITPPLFALIMRISYIVLSCIMMLLRYMMIWGYFKVEPPTSQILMIHITCGMTRRPLKKNLFRFIEKLLEFIKGWQYNPQLVGKACLQNELDVFVWTKRCLRIQRYFKGCSRWRWLET